MPNNTPQENKTQVVKAEKNSNDYLRIKIGIFLTGLSVFAQLYLFQPLLPELSREYNITPEYSSLAVSAGTIGMALGLFVLAFRADRVPRKNLMVMSIITASILTILTSFSTNFDVVIILCFLKGLALSGVTAVALAYLSEEVSIGILGVAIALYLSGNTIGGMLGRVMSLLIASQSNWHTSVLIIGIFCLILGLIFTKIFPASRNFKPQYDGFSYKLQLMKTFLSDKYLLALFFIGFSVMGSFVSIYNYLGFRLEAAPFHLPHSLIACVFLMYTIGVLGSMRAGKWSDTYSSKKIIWAMIALEILGLSLMFSNSIFVMVLGLGAVTFSFFAAHTLASRMVSQRAIEGKSTATCLYWLFYYCGSSFIGSASGEILTDMGWKGFIFALIGLMIISLVLSLWIRNFTLKKIQ